VTDINNLVKAQANLVSTPNQEVVNWMLKSIAAHWKQTASLTEQAQHFERWGYKKLAEATAADAEQEHGHAQALFERLEFYDVDYSYPPIDIQRWTRHDIVAIINFNLESDKEAQSIEKAGILAAREVGDELTAKVFIKLLKGSEQGILDNTADLKVIEQIGVDNFLTLQV
jgi:bacterioferritin (cytochrome b1)